MKWQENSLDDFFMASGITFWIIVVFAILYLLIFEVLLR